MKKLFLVFILCVLTSRISAQVVFCPPGAEWHYSFLSTPAWFGVFTYSNERIKYIRDSISNNDTLKILKHTRFYLACEDENPIQYYTTIKQKGDTIFFKNVKTQNYWQILYNFAATPGTGWYTTIFDFYGNLETYWFQVDSVRYVTINGKSFKQLKVGTNTITERFGRNHFMFPFENPGCDGNYFHDFLCYQDNTFGLKQFTGMDCNFSGINRVAEWRTDRSIQIYPNPASEILHIHTTEVKNDLELSFSDLSRRTIKKVQIDRKNDMEINIKDFSEGVYFVTILQDGRMLQTQKLIIVR